MKELDPQYRSSSLVWGPKGDLAREKQWNLSALKKTLIKTKCYSLLSFRWALYAGRNGGHALHRPRSRNKYCSLQRLHFNVNSRWNVRSFPSTFKMHFGGTCVAWWLVDTCVLQYNKTQLVTLHLKSVQLCFLEFCIHIEMCSHLEKELVTKILCKVWNRNHGIWFEK